MIKMAFTSLLYFGLITSAMASAQNGTCDDVLEDLAKKEKIHDHLVMPTAWMSSPEYIASCYQAYNLAKRNLHNALRRKHADDKKLAIILDLDETVLDNSAYQSEMATSDKIKTDAWPEWIKLEKAEAVPGAKEFLHFAQSKNVEIIYISNRSESFFESTVRNMQKLDLPIKNENLFLRKKSTVAGSKEDRRQIIQNLNYDVVLYIGDNLGDFHAIFEGKSNQDRLDAVELMKREFGKKFIYLSNPSYGDWENSLYNYVKNLTPKEKKEILEGQLRPYSDDSKLKK